MDDLIEALVLLRNYGSPELPTNCGHDVLYVNVDASLVSEEDKARLDRLGFFPCSEGGGFMSYKFGSC